jgi:hypothetical protein
MKVLTGFDPMMRAASIVRVITLMMEALRTSEASVDIQLSIGSISQKVLSFKEQLVP